VVFLYHTGLVWISMSIHFSSVVSTIRIWCLMISYMLEKLMCVLLSTVPSTSACCSMVWFTTIADDVSFAYLNSLLSFSCISTIAVKLKRLLSYFLHTFDVASKVCCITHP